MARDADTSAPMVFAIARNISKPSALPTPRPPEINTCASVMSTKFLVCLTVSRTRTRNLDLSKLIFTSSIVPFRFSSRWPMRITPGRTVDICGRCSLQMMVAIKLPPNAGRVINRSRSSEISNPVQSAVNPVSTRADKRGPRSRPMVVAPINTMLGLLSRMIW